MSGKPRYRRLLWLLLVLLVGAAAYAVGKQASWLTPPGVRPGAGDAASLRQACQGANVVICVIDAARADHVTCYGYPRETTPNINLLSQESVLFEEHFSQASSTKPSTTSLLTSQHQDTHLAFDMRALPDSAVTLEQWLREAGLHTVLFSSNPEASPWAGICRDFDEAFHQPQLEAHVTESTDVFRPEPLVDLITRWLENNRRERFFAYIHFMPPHLPYSAPDEMKMLAIADGEPEYHVGSFEFPQVAECRKPRDVPALPGWITLYDANMRYGDWAVGEVIRLLRQHRLLDSTILVVTSDHGEAFGEHGYVWHGSSVYEETIHVPLLIRFPQGRLGGKRIPSLTQSIDLMPTILDLLDLSAADAELQGRSCMPLLTGEAEKINDYIFARSLGEDSCYMVWGTEAALLIYEGATMQALYDLRADPGQTRNIASQDPGRVEALREVFLAHARRQRVPPLHFADPEAEPPTLPDATQIEMNALQRARLRALGYLR